jgi:hypothetical protein
MQTHTCSCATHNVQLCGPQRALGGPLGGPQLQLVGP